MELSLSEPELLPLSEPEFESEPLPLLDPLELLPDPESDPEPLPLSESEPLLLPDSSSEPDLEPLGAAATGAAFFFSSLGAGENTLLLVC